MCIKACNNYELDGKILTTTYGTTKYCTYFLTGTVCPKKECLYLHKLATQENTVPRENMPTKHIQGNDAAIDKIRVIVHPPSMPYKLPSARLLRERAQSDQIAVASPWTRPRTYSKENNLRSLFNLIEDGNESPTEVPQIVYRLRSMASPCKDQVEISTEDMQEIMSPTSPDK